MPPASPSLSASAPGVTSGQSVVLTAAGCAGTVTWGGGLGTGSSKTVSPTATASYTASCTVGGCASAAASVTVTVSSAPAGGCGGGLSASFYAGLNQQGAPLATAVMGVDLSGSQGQPLGGTGVAGVDVSGRWQGQVEAPVSGSYTFNARTDDGVRVWFDDRQVVDDYGDYAPTDHPFTVSLAAGQKYSIRIEWKQGGGGYEARLLWSYPGQAPVVVPVCRLYPVSSPGPAPCVPPASPSLSASAPGVQAGQPVVLTAAGCAGTVTWGGGLGTGSSKTVSPTATASYTASCTVGGCASAAASVTVTVSSAPAGGCGGGLSASFYAGLNQQGAPLATAVMGVDLSGSQGQPLGGTGVAGVDVSGRWQGQVEAPVSGSYTFNARTDDGVRVWFDDRQVVDDYGDYAPTDHPFTVSLAAGQKYSIRIEWKQGGGGYEARLLWSYPGQAPVVVPVCRLYPVSSPGPAPCVPPASPSLSASAPSVQAGQPVVLTAAGCAGTVTWGGGLGTGSSKTVSPTATASYTASCTVGGCASAAASVTVTVSSAPAGGCGGGLSASFYAGLNQQGAPLATAVMGVDLSGSQGQPLGGTGVAGVDVSGRWQGQVEAPVSGSYTFNARTDDGVRVWFDDRQVVDDYGDYAPTDHPFTVSLAAGQKYSIRIEWKQGGGGYEARLLWSYPGQAPVVVPVCRLYPVSSPGPAPCVPPASPSLSASAPGVTSGQSVVLTAAGCAGTVTWGGGLGTGSSKTVSPTATASYTASCTVGGCASAAASVTVTVSSAPAGGCGGGLSASFYAGLNQQGAPLATAVMGVDLSGSQGQPLGGTGVAGVDVSGRWQGQVEAPVSGSYTFNARTDDGVRVWFDDRQVVDDYGDYAPTDHPFTVSLAAGQKYSIRIEWKQGGGGYEARLLWSYPGQAPVVVPVCRLYPVSSPGPAPCVPPASPSLSASAPGVQAGQPVVLTAAGCAGTVTWGGGLGTGSSKTVSPTATASYTASCTVGGCASAAASVTVTVSSAPAGGCGGGLSASFYAGLNQQGAPLATAVMGVDLSGSQGQPLGGTGVAGVDVSGRWQGQVEAPVSGSYTFNARTDDGVRVWFDDRQVVDDYGDYAPTDHPFTVSLAAGQKYSIRIEWKQGGGGYEARLLWSYPGQAPVVVPVCRLYPVSSPGPAPCVPPASPSLSASAPSVQAGQPVVLTAAGCAGTVTWGGGLGTGSSKTVSPTATASYTASCTVGGCASTAASVTVTVSSAPVTPVDAPVCLSLGDQCSGNSLEIRKYTFPIAAGGSKVLNLTYRAHEKPSVGRIRINGGSWQSFNMPQTTSTVYQKVSIGTSALTSGNNVIELSSVDGFICFRELCTGGTSTSRVGILEDESVMTTEFFIFPNPTMGEFQAIFYVEKDRKALLIITDMLGREVFTKPLIGVGEHRETIQLTDQKEGMYLLILRKETDTGIGTSEVRKVLLIK